jgi:ketosteroid isomerase-like protein
MQKASLFLLLLGIVALVPVESKSQGAQTQDEQQLREIESRTAKCKQQNDVSMMSLFAEDFVVSGKKVSSKKQVEEAVRNNLAAHGNGPSPFTIEKRNMQVYIFGDTAVVTYIKEYRQTPDTTKFFDEDDTDVFKKGPKGWLLQFSKVSPAVVTPAN